MWLRNGDWKPQPYLSALEKTLEAIELSSAVSVPCIWATYACAVLSEQAWPPAHKVPGGQPDNLTRQVYHPSPLDTLNPLPWACAQFFEDKLGPQCMQWLEDSVFCIREAATRNLMKLAQEFGPDWARIHLVPPVCLRSGQEASSVSRLRPELLKS